MFWTRWYWVAVGIIGVCVLRGVSLLSQWLVIWAVVTARLVHWNSFMGYELPHREQWDLRRQCKCRSLSKARYGPGVTPCQNPSLCDWCCEGSDFILMRGGGCRLPTGISPRFYLWRQKTSGLNIWNGFVKLSGIRNVGNWGTFSLLVPNWNWSHFQGEKTLKFKKRCEWEEKWVNSLLLSITLI